MYDLNFNKIIIIGNSSSGKTTLGETLCKKLNIQNYDLDEYHWLPNWVERADNEMIELVKDEILTNEKWIISGNYTSIMEFTTWLQADAIIWLKYSKWTCLWRCFKRSLVRSIWKVPCCNGNYESFRHSFFTWNEENLFYYIYKNHDSRLAKFEHFKNVKFKDKKWFVFETPKSLDAFLKQI